jgi:hypothetical protein
MMTRSTMVRTTGLLAGGALAAAMLAGCAGLSSGQAVGSGTNTPVLGTSAASTSSAPTTRASGGGATTRPSTPAQTPECKATDLTLTLGPASGAAGHFYQALDFTNKSAHACVLVGFPGVSYVGNGSGQQVGQPAQRDGQIGPQLTLQPGKVASAIVARTDVSVFDAAACQPTPVDGLRVYPPDETASMFVSLSGTGCAGNPPSPQLLVQTVKPGAGSV